MKYKLNIWEDQGEWWWSIEDEYLDEVASTEKPFATEDDARKDGRYALMDWRG